jgi:uncharacterized membrane protein YhaH (DUF805 family)
MTTPPAPTDPLATVPYAPAPAPPPRPQAVTVLAGIGILFGALGLLCKPVGLLYVLVQIPHPVLEAIRGDSFIRGWTVVSVGTGWLISLLLLLSSVGSLRLRDWGRAGMLAYAFLAVVMTFVGRTVELRVVEPALQPALRQVAAQQPAAGRFQMGGMKGYAVGLAAGLWFPTVIVFILNRRAVKRAFEEGPPGEAGI